MAIVAFMATLMFCQVVARYLNNSIFWAEEVLRLSMVWVTFLASPLVYERAEHPGFKALPNKMGILGKKSIWIISNILVAMVSWWLFYYGIKLCQSSNYISANGIPRYVFVLPAVIGGFYTLLIALVKIVQIIQLTPQEVDTWKA